jgi:hypothetical protein
VPPPLSVLSQLFVTERHRQRTNSSVAVAGFSVPALSELEAAEGIEPLLASNMRHGFLPTRVSSQGLVRYGFSECSVEQEEALLGVLYQALRREAVKGGWGTVGTVSEACERMRGRGLEPAVVIQPEPKDDTLPVFSGPLPEGSSLVVAKPEAAGVYTRVGGYVGILVYRIDSAFVVVEP